MFFEAHEVQEIVECELLQSQDYGKTWSQIAPRRPFIPRGASTIRPDGSTDPKGNAFDSHTVYTAWTGDAAPFLDPKDPTRTKFYYSGGDGPHSGQRDDSIGVAYATTHAWAGLSLPMSSALSGGAVGPLVLTTEVLSLETGDSSTAAAAAAAATAVSKGHGYTHLWVLADVPVDCSVEVHMAAAATIETKTETAAGADADAFDILGSITGSAEGLRKIILKLPAAARSEGEEAVAVGMPSRLQFKAFGGDGASTVLYSFGLCTL